MPSQPDWYATNAIMGRAEFSQDRFRRAQIWAARHRSCPKCQAPAFAPCRNLTGIKNMGFEMARVNKFPHTERVDYDMLESKLNEMGYE